MENKKQKIDVIKLELPVTGMSCAGCAVGVEKKVAGSSGVKSAAVNFANKSIMVEFDPSVTDTAKLKQSVQEAGYDLIIEEYGLTEEASEEREQKYYRSLRHNTIMSWLFALPVMVISMFFMEHRALQYVVFLLTIPVVAIFGRDFFIKGFKGIGKGGVGMDTLVALSTSIAFIFSTFNLIFPHFWGSRGLEADLYFEAATMIIAFVLLGRLLEEKAKGNTTSAIKKLMALQPKEATLVDESGAGKVVPISSLVPGNIVRVKPGEQIAVDGSVVSGNSYVDESTITGESVAVLKVNGEKLFAGTINQKGSLDFKVEKVGGDTLLGQIVKAVKDAQGSKAPVQKIVDKVAAIFVPTVIVIAIITLSVWLIFGGKAMVSHALLATVSVLVIACPCALGLATPTAIMVGMGKGAREHILIKDATALEQMKRVDTVVLDKTGTITKGEPTVSDWIWLDTVEEERRDWLNKIIYSIEALSEHPLAEAIIAHIALAGKGERVEVSNFKSITGVGVEAQFEGERYYLGSYKGLGVESKEIEQRLKLLEGRSVVVVAKEGTPILLIGVSDTIRSSSAKAVDRLNKMGVEVHLLTGDNNSNATHVARKVGIVHYKGEVLPQEKEDYITQLQSKGRVVAMVGDGINDSQALSRANVSIAMGKGSDIAMDVAMATLISPDIALIPKAIELSRKTVKLIHQNLFWAFIYNLIAIPIAAGILYPVTGTMLNPMIAAAAMAFSSVSVVTNSLRLGRVKL